MTTHALRGRTRYPGIIDNRLRYTINPLNYANCEHWLKADAIVGLNDGDLVQTWPDSSGNGRDGTQATEGVRPAYKTNRLNGLPAVYFAIGKWMTAGYDPSVPYTLFLVYKRIGSGNRVLNGSNNWLVGPYGAVHSFYNSGWIQGGAVAVNQSVYTTIIQYSANDGAVMRQDGTQRGVDALYTLPGTLKFSNGEDADHDAYELIQYSRALGSTEIADIETYLAGKYGL